MKEHVPKTQAQVCYLGLKKRFLVIKKKLLQFMPKIAHQKSLFKPKITKVSD